jgi:hypothetical protein
MHVTRNCPLTDAVYNFQKDGKNSRDYFYFTTFFTIWQFNLMGLQTSGPQASPNQYDQVRYGLHSKVESS